MDIEKLLSTLPPDVRDSSVLQGLKVLVHTLMKELQETKERLIQAKEQLTEAKAKIESLEDELRRLRKLPKRPKFRPNGMEPRTRNKAKRNDSGPTPPAMNAAFVQKEISEVKICAQDVPEGSRFKGYQPFTVQELGLTVKETTYKLERWQTPDGKMVTAKLPDELKNEHFGPTLKAFMTSMYVHGMTQPSIHEFLVGLGFEISTGSTNDILLNEAEQYAGVGEEILTAGLQEAPFIRADDTGAKHKHKACYCTHIGGEFFAYYKTTSGKSRDNFLKILLQGKEGYEINESMIWHLFQSGVKDDILNLLEEHQGKSYSSAQGFNHLLNSLGVEGKKLRKQCHEAGVVGYLVNSVLKSGQVFLSDRAGQFALFLHAACWVHMERPLRKVVCSSEFVEEELRQVRESIWITYRALKEAHSEEEKAEVRKLYDRLVGMKTSSDEINAVIRNFASYREELLRALDHPGLPLHNNDSERDIRPVAKRRNISGSTKSEEGLKLRDGLLTLKQTCFRLGCSFWEYLQLWFRGRPPDLAQLVRQRYRTARA